MAHLTAFTTPISLPQSVRKSLPNSGQRHLPKCQTPSPKRPRPPTSLQSLSDVANSLQQKLTPPAPRSKTGKRIARAYVSALGIAERAMETISIQASTLFNKLPVAAGWRALRAFEWQLPVADFERREEWINKVRAVVGGEGWGGIVKFLGGVLKGVERVLGGVKWSGKLIGEAKEKEKKDWGSSVVMDEFGVLHSTVKRKPRYRHSGQVGGRVGKRVGIGVRRRLLDSTTAVGKNVATVDGFARNKACTGTEASYQKIQSDQEVSLHRGEMLDEGKTSGKNETLNEETVVETSVLRTRNPVQRATTLDALLKPGPARNAALMAFASIAAVSAGGALPVVASVTATAAVLYGVANAKTVKETAVHVRVRGILNRSRAFGALRQKGGAVQKRTRREMDRSSGGKIGKEGGGIVMDATVEQVGETVPAIMSVPVLGWILGVVDWVLWMGEGRVQMGGWTLLGGLEKGWERTNL